MRPHRHAPKTIHVGPKPHTEIHTCLCGATKLVTRYAGEATHGEWGIAMPILKPRKQETPKLAPPVSRRRSVDPSPEEIEKMKAEILASRPNAHRPVYSSPTT